MFPKLVNGCLPAPFLFERYNFNPFKILGRFSKYRNEKNASTIVMAKGVGANFFVDESQKQVNSQGFMSNAKGDLIDRCGKVVFDSRNLKDKQLPMLYNYLGDKFSIFDVMGCLALDSKHQLVFGESKRNPQSKVDLGGHLVSEKGYLTNEDGDIVNRKGAVVFSARDLKSGEFPKIFHFSRFELKNIQGTYKKNTENTPILFTFPDGSLKDDNAKTVNQRGFLADDQGNIVDLHGNIMFENDLISNELKLPYVLSKRKLVRQDSGDDISDLLQQIEDDLNSSAGADASMTRFAPPSQRHLGNRTFNNESPGRLQPENRSSHSSSSPERKHALRSQKKLKMVRQESWHEKDIQMANVYGGEPKPRVRMIPKRFQSKERSSVLRDSSILSPTQMLVVNN